MENYRGTTLMDTGYKMYAEWLRKLGKELEEKQVLDRTQFGFEKEKVRAYILSETIKKQIRKENGKIFVCFADLKAAFDKFKRNEIWRILKKKNVEDSL